MSAPRPLTCLLSPVRTASLLACAASLLACDAGKSSAVAPSRVEAIAAKQDEDPVASLCDIAPAKATAPSFELPSVEGTPSSARGPRWVNLWATWCPPCVEELPRLHKLVDALEHDGQKVALQLVSVDTTAAAVDTFISKHPELKSSLDGTVRLTDPAALAPWLTSLGLDQGATLPVHVLVDSDGKVSCARTGAVRDSDLPALKRVLAARP